MTTSSLDRQAVEKLSVAVVAQAVKDYQAVCTKLAKLTKEIALSEGELKSTLQRSYKKAMKQYKELDAFFDSAYFEAISPMSRSDIMREIEKRAA